MSDGNPQPGLTDEAGDRAVPAVSVATTDALRLDPDWCDRVERASTHVLIHPGQGRGRHMVDFRWHTVAPDHVVHIQPGQVHRWDPAGGFTAAVILVRPDACPIGLFEPADPHPLVALEGAAAVVAAVAADLVAEQARPDPNPAVMAAGATLILHHVAQAARRASTIATDRADLLRAFRSEVEGSFATTRSVSHYARAIGTSPKTLSRATGSLTGRSPKELIDRRVILEAQRLLSHTTESVSSIAAALGFSEATNFTKFFVRHTGTSPLEFRVVGSEVEPDGDQRPANERSTARSPLM